jgi:hypothetical protein
VPEIMQPDLWQASGESEPVEDEGHCLRVVGPAVLPREDVIARAVRAGPCQALRLLCDAPSLEATTVVGSRAMSRRERAVLGVDVITSWSTLTLVLLTRRLPASRSRASHVSPATSPRRSPVVAARSHNGYK